MATSTHIGNFGKFAPAGATVDLDGYIALPGAKLDDHCYDGVDLEVADEETDYWRETWWPEVIAANARAVVEAEAALAEWQATD